MRCLPAPVPPPPSLHIARDCPLSAAERSISRTRREPYQLEESLLSSFQFRYSPIFFLFSN